MRDARDFITQNLRDLPGDTWDYAYTALSAKITVYSGGDWGATGIYGHAQFGEVISLRKDAFNLDHRLLASLLVHEAVHRHQWGWRKEAPAYQVQSDVLNAWGLAANSYRSALRKFGVNEDESSGAFIENIIEAFRKYQTTNAAFVETAEF